MISDLDSVLEDCLERLAQGETLQACLTLYPEYAAELKPLLRAAALLEEQADIRPSAAFKARTRAKLYAHMQAHPRPSRRWWMNWPMVFRLTGGLAVLLLAFALTGTALAQAALPGAASYPWKLASEQAWLVVSPDPVGFDLFRADRRVDEALAVSGDPAAQEIAMTEYVHTLKDLEKYQGVADQLKIQPTLKLQQEKLRNIGLMPLDVEISSTTNSVQATPIPVSTQKNLPLPKPTLIPSKLVPTHILPTVPSIPKIVPTKIRIPTVQIPIIPVVP